MRTRVEVQRLGTTGPVVVLLAGLGARGSGFRPLADRLAVSSRPVLVEYPEGRLAACGPGTLALAVREAIGSMDAVVGSSYGGLVAAHLAARGHVRGLALVGSFTHPDQLGVRGLLVPLLGAAAVLGRPGPVAARIAARGRIAPDQVPHIVPTTPAERWSVVLRSLAARRETPPPLRDAPVSCICLHGDLDPLVPVEILPGVARALPPFTPLHVLRGAGHVPYHTHADACAGLLGPWLARLGT